MFSLVDVCVCGGILFSAGFWLLHSLSRALSLVVASQGSRTRHRIALGVACARICTTMPVSSNAEIRPSARSKMPAGSPVFGLSGKLTRFSHCLEHESIWIVCLERRVVYEWKPIVFLDPDNLHCDSPRKVK